MALKKCKECGNEISTKAESCPKCGYAVLKEKQRKNATLGCVGCAGIITFILAFAAYLANLTSEYEKETPRTEKKVSVKAPIPYGIIKKDSYLDYKLSLDVRLEGPCGENDLKELSKYLHKKYNGKKYKRVFICYYLPEMIVDHGAWATGHFNPKLEIKILGTT